MSWVQKAKEQASTADQMLYGVAKAAVSPPSLDDLLVGPGLSKSGTYVEVDLPQLEYLLMGTLKKLEANIMSAVDAALDMKLDKPLDKPELPAWVIADGKGGKLKPVLSAYSLNEVGPSFAQKNAQALVDLMKSIGLKPTWANAGCIGFDVKNVHTMAALQQIDMGD